jgi:hypothetical protein
MAKAYKHLRRRRTERRVKNQSFMEPSKRPLTGKQKRCKRTSSGARLDEGTFTEGHELDRKWQVPKEMIGRRLTQEEARGCWLS